MSALVLAALGAGVGLGVALLLAGIAGRPVLRLDGRSMVDRVSNTTAVARAATASIGGLAVLVVTGWIAGGALAVLAILFSPRIVGGKAEREASVARTEAIASWTEMIRDSIAAASGLEEAIVATEPVAPRPIQREVRRLANRLRHSSLPDALRGFGDDVAHPSADLVVAALTIAAQMEASDLTGLLSRLAESIRGEARMRIRVEVGRTRVRTATKVILGVVAATVVLLTLLNRGYLAAYDSPGGQFALIVVGGIFAVGGWLLARMSGLELPDRFTARRTSAVQR